MLIKRLYGEKNVELGKRQALLLGEPEIRYLTKVARQAIETGSTPKAAEAALDAELNKGDGKRNLAEVIRLTRLEAGATSFDFIGYFRFLERHGYVEFVK